MVTIVEGRSGAEDTSVRLVGCVAQAFCRIVTVATIFNNKLWSYPTGQFEFLGYSYPEYDSTRSGLSTTAIKVELSALFFC